MELSTLVAAINALGRAARSATLADYATYDARAELMRAADILTSSHEQQSVEWMLSHLAEEMNSLRSHSGISPEDPFTVREELLAAARGSSACYYRYHYLEFTSETARTYVLKNESEACLVIVCSCSVHA